MTYKLDTKKPHIICLILLLSFPSVATVFISPALPAISAFFDVTEGYAQQLITLFVVGYALGQLLYSPLANRFGRKKTVYIGISLYLFSCIICFIGIYSHSLHTILVGRFLMALGSSVGMIISFTIINDFYHPHQARSVVSYTVLSYAFMPGLSVALGGFITSHFYWIDCFYFLFIYGVIVLLASTRLPETLIPENKKTLHIKHISSSYKAAFTNAQLLTFSIIFGLMTSYIYIIASETPFIGIDTIGLTPALYGTLFLIPYCGQIIGALLAGKISAKLTPYTVMLIGYFSTIFGSVSMFIFFILNWINTFSLLMPVLFIMMGLPITYSTVSVMAVGDIDDKATGSAVMSFITMSITLLATLLITVLPTNQPIMMPSLFILIAIMAIVGFIIVKKRYPDH